MESRMLKQRDHLLVRELSVAVKGLGHLPKQALAEQKGTLALLECDWSPTSTLVRVCETETWRETCWALVVQWARMVSGSTRHSAERIAQSCELHCTAHRCLGAARTDR